MNQLTIENKNIVTLDEVKKIKTALKAWYNDTRMSIVNVIQQELKLSVTRIKEELKMEEKNISGDMRILREYGIVKFTWKGGKKLHSMDKDGFGAMKVFIRGFSKKQSYSDKLAETYNLWNALSRARYMEAIQYLIDNPRKTQPDVETQLAISQPRASQILTNLVDAKLLTLNKGKYSANTDLLLSLGVTMKEYIQKLDAIQAVEV